MFTAGSLLAICIVATAPETTIAINTGNFLRGASTGQIINGTEVKDEAAKYSFFVLPSADENTNRWLGCGASIISPTWGLTAAHCFGGGLDPCSHPGFTKKVKLWMGDLHLSDFVISGETGENKKHAVIEAEVVCHPQFDGKCSHGHDMTLLRLTKKVPDWVKPVPLDLGGTGLTRGASKEGEVTTNIGFGNTETSGDVQLISDTPPLKMREAELTIFKDDYKACASVYAGGFGCSDPESEGKATNLEQQLCAGATDNPQRDTCSGDSGSPMLDKNGVQIGIVSYGGGPGEKKRGPGRMCADPEYMGVYTRVSAFAEFIHKHVKDLPSSTGTTQSSSHI